MHQDPQEPLSRDTGPRASAGKDEGPLLHVLNPCPYPRTQWVLYGAREAQEVLRKLPRSYINIARVHVPANHVGEVHALPPLPAATPFTLHRAVAAMFDRGFEPWFECNGERKTLTLVRLLADHARLKVALWRARTKQGICELITYSYHDQAAIPFELSVYCESKDQHWRPMKFRFGLTKTEGVGLRLRHGNPGELLATDRMADAQGRRWFGSLLCYDKKTLEDEDEGPSLRAEEAFPLLAMSTWKTWGPWNKPSHILPKELQRQILLEKSGKPYHEPFGHFGWILNKRCGDTGFQPAFGTWQHLDCISNSNATVLFLDRLIMAQETCRPIHFFEEDGSIVRAAKHPQYVSWDETVHWSKGQSPDRLGRTHKREDLRGTDWHGRDREHYAANWLAEDALLHGSYGSLREIEHLVEHILAGLTVPSIQGNKATNGMGAARGIGRMYQAMVQMWMASGDDRILERVEKRILECLLPQAAARTEKGEIRPLRVIVDDRALPGREAWIPWEDAIAVQGMDAMVRALHESGRKETAAKLADLTWLVGRSNVLYAWHPQRLIIGKALAYNADGSPMPASAIEDTKLMLWSYNTDYSYWALPCLFATLRMAKERKDQRVADRARALLDTLLPGSADKMTRVPYLGAW